MEILLIEDHLPTAQSVKTLLSSTCHVTHVATHAAAERSLANHSYSAILADLHLPDGTGLSLCANHHTTPVIIFSGTQDIKTKVIAFEAGADDYITKPFSFPELQARINAAVRRREKCQPNVECIGSFALDHHNTEVHYEQTRSILTVCEYHIISKLIQHKDTILSKEELLADEAGAIKDSTPNSVEAHIKNLRKKLHIHKKNKLIETIYGIGYRFNTKYT